MRNITDRLESDGPASGLEGETDRCYGGAAVEAPRRNTSQSGRLLVRRSGLASNKGFFKTIAAFSRPVLSSPPRYGGGGDDNGGGDDEIGKDRLLRMTDVMQIVGVSDKTIYRHMNQGLFPRSVRIGPNSVAWRESVIMAWIAGLPPANEDSANAR